MITYGSLFSGAGGFEIGLNKLGWKCEWMCEKDKYAQSVLRYNWPDVTMYEDVTTLTEPKFVDVIVGGFPCQDLSTAGLGAGFDGEKSVLFYEFVRIVQEMREKSDGEYPRAIIWENVPGILNKSKNWIDCVYSAWAEIGALVQEHRVIDLKYFGVPQRRRRVLGTVIFDPRVDGGREILSDTDSIFGNLKKIGEKGENSAEATQGSATEQCWNPHIAGTLLAHDAKDIAEPEAKLVVMPFDITQITSAANKSSPDYGDVHGTLSASAHAPKIAYSITPLGGQGSLLSGKPTDVSNCLTAIDAPDRGTKITSDYPVRIRKLTEIEMERLMGWDDNHTALGIWKDKERPLSQHQRRKMCGNGLASPCAEWVGRRVELALENND